MPDHTDTNKDGSVEAPQHLRCEYLENPLGIDETIPRFSWWVSDSRRGAEQSAYEIKVGRSAEELENTPTHWFWDSSKVISHENSNIEYAGPILHSRQRYFWQVRTWDANDEFSPWSEINWWEMGLLDLEDWSAKWVGLPDRGPVPRPCQYLRKSFEVPSKKVHRARVYVTALGVYELYLNGQRIGNQRLAPGWTDYRKRVLYQTFDLTTFLSPEENVIAAVLGDGWYIGDVSFGRNRFGTPPPKLLSQLEIEFEDGSTNTIISDSSWLASTGPIKFSELYDGETYDARLEMPGWSLPGFLSAGWESAKEYLVDNLKLKADILPPIRITAEIKPISMQSIAPHTYVYDFGQNIAGVCRLSVQGAPGDIVKLRHAEVLHPDGSLSVENLRGAKVTDTYILSGKTEGETFVPHFTYHGFRYVELTSFPGEPSLNTLTALVLHTDATFAGEIVTSNDLVNRIYRAIQWTQRDNLHSVITDCCNRDERLGWMAEAQINSSTAMYNMDLATFFTKYIYDIEDAQFSTGAYPDTVPWIEGIIPTEGAPGWGDGGVIIPWYLYKFYGDKRILQRHFPSMTRYIDFITRHNPGGLWTKHRGNDHGDWLPPVDPYPDKTMFATLYYFYSTSLVAKIASILGLEVEEQRYQKLANKIERALNRFYLQGERYSNNYQTLNAMVLTFKVAPAGVKPNIAALLLQSLEAAWDIQQNGIHLVTGTTGTRLLLPVLSELGRSDLAYYLILQKKFPSWGYMLEKGGTTLWEHWNGDSERPEMNSYNHLAFSSVCEWMYRYLAGIDQAEGSAGFKKILVRPQIVETQDEINWVKTSYASITGIIATEWKKTAEQIDFYLVVPANARAAIILPAASIDAITENEIPITQVHGLADIQITDHQVLFDIGAGTYHFKIAIDE
jgi:alpha-L-rhamnosidase